jgi:hypothetical protein
MMYKRMFETSNLKKVKLESKDKIKLLDINRDTKSQEEKYLYKNDLNMPIFTWAIQTKISPTAKTIIKYCYYVDDGEPIIDSNFKQFESRAEAIKDAIEYIKNI